MKVLDLDRLFINGVMDGVAMTEMRAAIRLLVSGSIVKGGVA